MKKFSTITMLPVFTSLLTLITSLVCSSVFAIDEMHPPKTNCKFLANAPDQHVVVKGDTLWGISQMFLEHAWCWPQVWGMNREEIKNPHWIYPGQIVYFDRVHGRLRLGKSINGPDSNMPTVRISPQIRSEKIIGNAITTIPYNSIEPFLSQPLVLEENELSSSPHIVAAQDGHVIAGKSEKVYATGNLNGLTLFQIYRPSTPLIDPETKKVLGYESAFVGTAKLTKAGKEPNEASSFLVTSSKEEVAVGDKLLPVPKTELTNYVPHAPEGEVNGRIVSVYGGVAQAGQNQTVAINLGEKDGMDIGTVLKMFRLGPMIVDTKSKEKSLVKLPDEEYGTLFVYRVFKNVSYGLIMHVTDTAQVGDIVRTPE